MKSTSKMIRPAFSMSYGLISQKWFSKLQFSSLKIRKDLFNEYYRDTCEIDKEDMIAFMEANSKYEIKDSLQNTNAKVLVVVGDKERPIMKKSASLIHQKINESRIEILPNYYHGEFSINNPQQYVVAINELIANRKKQIKSELEGNERTNNLENENIQLEERSKTKIKSLDER